MAYRISAGTGVDYPVRLAQAGRGHHREIPIRDAAVVEPPPTCPLAMIGVGEGRSVTA
jgi:hypothetical protein